MSVSLSTSLRYASVQTKKMQSFVPNIGRTFGIAICLDKSDRLV
jgi:hypothetical protein